MTLAICTTSHSRNTAHLYGIGKRTRVPARPPIHISISPCLCVSIVLVRDRCKSRHPKCRGAPLLCCTYITLNKDPFSCSNIYIAFVCVCCKRCSKTKWIGRRANERASIMRRKATATKRCAVAECMCVCACVYPFVYGEVHERICCAGCPCASIPIHVYVLSGRARRSI